MAIGILWLWDTFIVLYDISTYIMRMNSILIIGYGMFSSLFMHVCLFYVRRDSWPSNKW
jgi:hypothetical protein